jgi:hypothetical protein
LREAGRLVLILKNNDFFIPNLGSFDLLVYTDKDLIVPEKWEESGPSSLPVLRKLVFFPLLPQSTKWTA